MPRKTALPTTPADHAPLVRRPSLESSWLIAAALVLGVALAYGPLCLSDPVFLELDDYQYVVDNPHVHGGLTTENVAWAFTTYRALNWHPLIWLSLQLDADLYGPNPTGFHVTNVVLHAANSVLLFLLLRRATAAVWPSAFVAGLFALHPQHVESVAWIAERKDVLSTLFWLLTMYAYVWYAKHPGRLRYALVVLIFAVGLTAKQMLVTLPVILLLFDYWPLRRVGRTPWRWLVLEKLPLLALAVAAGLLTIHVQRVGQERVLPGMSPQQRVLNASLACVEYIGQTAWPSGLAPMYTRPLDRLPVAGGIAAFAGLLLATGAALWLVKRQPPVTVGWLWYLVTLAPVIGLIQVGIQTRADRYTYVPHIGLFILLAWGPLAWLARRVPRPLAFALAGVTLLACLFVTRNQALLWRDDRTLWEHAVAETRDNFGAMDNLGVALGSAGQYAEAEKQFREAVRLEPHYAVAHFHLGQALKNQQRYAEAAASFADAIRQAPSYHRAHRELGLAYLTLGDAEAAIGPLTTAVQGETASANLHYSLATALLYRGRWEEAERQAEEVLRLKPNSFEAHDLLGTVLAVTRRPAEAEAQFRAAREAAKDADPYAEFFLGWSLNAQGRGDESGVQYRDARSRFPGWPQAVQREAWTLATHRDPHRRNGALALLRADMVSQALEEGDATALDTLAAAHAELGQFEEASKTGRKAANLARRAGQTDLATRIDDRVRGYENRQPARE